MVVCQPYNAEMEKKCLVTLIKLKSVAAVATSATTGLCFGVRP